MNVVMLSPGFPAEIPLFTRALAGVGARVIGVGEHPPQALPEELRHALVHYIQVPSIFDEDRVVAEIRSLSRRIRIDRVECLWEPLILLAAGIRRSLGIEGMSAERATVFRDKERMKLDLDAAGIRTPRHAAASTETQTREAVQRIGYPLILKPVAGAGSADTHRVDDATQLERILPQVRHVRELSVEEFIEGEEYTFDTICAGGEILYYNVSWYRPKPLIGRTVEWISPQTVALRHPDREELRAGCEMGRAVLRTLGFETGFTHMEWFLTPSGEAVFGEIAARPPGARSVDLMNYACDIDTYSGWAEAACHGRLTQLVERRYNSAVIFKRARGTGRIRRIEGLERLVARFRPHIVCVDLLPTGAPRRNWKQTLISDGYLIVRHPDLSALMEMADRIGTDLQLFAE